MPNVLITGASSGLGAALSWAYASEGTHLFLCGRDLARLEAVAVQAKDKGALVNTEIIDVRDRNAMNAWILSVDADHPLDLLIANAGVSAGTGKGDESEDQNKEIFDINVHGVFHTIFPILPRMKARRCGQIAIMSSLASYRGIPGAPSYAASKAAIRVYGEALRCELAPFGVRVNVICPGFIETPMTAVNDFPMPFLITAEAAALRIQKGLLKNEARIAFPWPLASLLRLLAALPINWTDALFSRLPRK